MNAKLHKFALKKNPEVEQTTLKYAKKPV